MKHTDLSHSFTMTNKDEEYNQFEIVIRSILSLFLCFGIFINSTLIYVVWTRKSLHQSLFIFMICFAVCDITESIHTIVSGSVSFLFPFGYHSCKLNYFLKTMPRIFKPLLLSIVFVVFVMRPNISRRSSFNIIKVLSILSVICALPETLDAEVRDKPFGNTATYCISILSNQPYMKIMLVAMQAGMPAALLIGYFVIKLSSDRWMEMKYLSNVQQLMLFILAIYIVCWTPYTITRLYNRFLERKIFVDFHDYLHLLHYTHFLASMSLMYKPFLLYCMNEEFKIEVNQIFNRENSEFVSFENPMSNDDARSFLYVR